MAPIYSLKGLLSPERASEEALPFWLKNVVISVAFWAFLSSFLAISCFWFLRM